MIRRNGGVGSEIRWYGDNSRIAMPQQKTRRTHARRVFIINSLVEVAGIEPASANPLPLALHAYPTLLFLTGRHPSGRVGGRRFREF